MSDAKNGVARHVEPEEVNFKGDENEERGNWSNKLDFILSCLGYAVGLGNVWRFPYLAYKNGGGAFLIPYVIMLFFAGLPLFILEVSLGQYCSLGPISCWRSVPLFRGIGYCQMVTAFYVGIYYNVIIMYTVYYFGVSFTSSLPWVGCDNSWNNLRCYDLFPSCIDSGGIIIQNGTCSHLSSLDDTTLANYSVTLNSTVTNSSDPARYNLSNYVDPLQASRQLSSEQYWKGAVLQEADSMNEPGGIIWQLAVCLLISWVVVYLCLVRGIKSSGKVVYFTATFPYIVLVILLVRGLTLPGASEGIKFFITPDLSKLSDAGVWQDAAIQIFYSLSAAGGGLTTLASYNKFHNNAYTDSLFVAIANCLTSVFAGFVIFSIVGFMAHELGQPVDTVVDQGFGLAFVAYPAAVARMPLSPLWSVLFFGMLFTLGLDSQFAIMENLVTMVVDEFPQTLRKRKNYVMLVFCILMFFLGFSCITHTGSYWVSHLDSYGAFFNYLVYALLECLAIAWFYGAKRFTNDVRSMVGNGWINWTFLWWPLNWSAFTPGLMLFVLLFNWLYWVEPSYNGPFPHWAVIIGWLMTTMSLMWIPIIAVYEFIVAKGSFTERWRALTNPKEVWGPALPQFRIEAARVHREHGTNMGGRIDIDGSGRPVDVKSLEMENNV